MFKRRQKKHSGIEKSEEGWAVSYADLLMVLMSFFIIFFNQDEQKNELIQNLSFNLVKSIGAVETNEKGEHVDKKEYKKEYMLHDFQKSNKERVISSVSQTQETLEKAGIRFHKIGSALQDNKDSKWNTLLKKGEGTFKGGIVIDLSDDVYLKGMYHIGDKAKSELNLLLDALAPYKDRVNLVFIGHADSVPMGKERKIIQDNMILSTLRASKAVEYTIEKGFNPYWVSAQGMGEYFRSTRSLSLRVMER